MAIAILLAAVALVWRVGLWAKGVPLLGNLIFLLHPLVHQVSSQVVSGQFPLWNPYTFTGSPLLADPQAGVLAPQHILFSLFPWETAFRLNLAVSLSLAVFFTWCLARRLGLPPRGAWLAGFLGGANGFLFYHSGHIVHMDSLVFLPAVLLFWSAGSGVLMGLALALAYLGGHPFFVLMALVGCLFMRPARPLRTLVAAGSVALGVSAVQMWPAIEFFSVSMRSGALMENAIYSNSLDPDSLWRMLGPFWNREAGNFVGDPTITSFYVGAPALLLALWGAWGGSRTRAPALWSAAGLCLALGPYTPFYSVMLKVVPGLGLFRFPAQWLWLATIGLALLAGVGYSRLGKWRLAVLGLVFLDLWFFMSLAPTWRSSAQFYAHRPKSLKSLALGPDMRVAHTRAFLRSQTRTSEVPVSGGWEEHWLALKEALVPSSGSVFQVREVLSEAAYAPRDGKRLVGPLLHGRHAESPPLLKFLGVRVLVDSGGPEGHRLIRWEDPRPRVTWVGRAKVLGGEKARVFLRSRDFNPEREVVLETGTGGTGGGPVREGRVTGVSETPTRLTVGVESPGPGYLVWADSYYLGWRAYVDGRRVEVLKANQAYRAVRVPAGSKEVRFRYGSLSFKAGLALLAFVLAVLGGAALKRVGRIAVSDSDPSFPLLSLRLR